MRLPARLTLLALAVAATALAGCSGGDPEAPAGPAATATSTSTGPPPPPKPTTETLHFLAAPDMATVLPGGGDQRTPVGLGGDGGGPGGNMPEARWTYQVRQHTNVTAGEVRVWVEIKEQVFPSPFRNPTDPQCSWRLIAEIGADVAALEVCLNEPVGPVNAGIKELVFPLTFADGTIELEANETVAVTLQRDLVSFSPNNAVDALSGSMEHDSRITLKGLKEVLG